MLVTEDFRAVFLTSEAFLRFFHKEKAEGSDNEWIT